MPPLDELANTILQSSNQVVDSLEKDNFFNKLLLEQFGWMRIFRTLLLFAAFALFGWLLWRIWNSRTQSARGRIAKFQEFKADLQDPVEQIRLQSKKRNFQPAARSVVRASFSRMAEASAEGRLVDRSQILRLFPWHALRKRNQIRRLWSIGFGSEQSVVRPKAFKKLFDDLKELEGFLERQRSLALSSANRQVPTKKHDFHFE